MKKILNVLLVGVTLVSCLFLTSCKKTNIDNTIVTIDINPSIEFIIDSNNKVVSVTALNDDGSILLVGEVFIGLDIEEATNKLLTLAANMGYLVENIDNNVKIAITGMENKAKELYSVLEEELKETLDKMDIDAHIEQAKALNKEALVSLAGKVSTYTEEELKDMSEEELHDVILAGRIETALLLTEEMREVYYQAKEYEISFVEREETAKLINALGEQHKFAYVTYKNLLDAYSENIKKLDKIRYEVLVSPDSEYQQSLTKLREAKAEFLKQRTYTYTLDVNGEEYKTASVTLQMKEETYNKMLKAYEDMGETVNHAMESLINALRLSENTLRSLEDKFDKDIKTTLKQNAKKIEGKINIAKDNFFDSFEEQYKDDLTKLEETLKKQKEELKK